MGSSRTFGIARPCLVAVALVASLACSGQIGDPTRDRPDDPAAPVTCDARVAALPGPLLRLANDEHERALRQLFGDDAVAAIASSLSAIPEDRAEEGVSPFARTDQRLTTEHVRGWYRSADAIAQAVSSQTDLRSAVVGDCAASAIDDDCLRAFTERLLRRAQRREPSTGEVDAVLASASDFSGFERVHAVIFLTLMSPDFLYRFENRGELEDDHLALTDHELASRLAFHFWGEPPDVALLDAADAGELATDEGYLAQVDRLIADPRAAREQVRFFEEWLHLQRGDVMSSPRLDVLAGGLDTDGLAAEMQQEVRDLVAFHLERGDSWADVLRSPYSLARTERLAAIYGVPAWDGEGDPPRLPEGERSGLLTRAGMLYTSDGSTNPFRRGAFVRREILCDTVLSPPADLPPDALTPPPVEPGTTTREAFAAKVEDEPCASCHASFTPLGFALEAYDGLGRFRAEEWLVTVDGEDQGLAPVDTRTIPEIESGDRSESPGPVDLSERIAASPKANGCFAERYVSYTFRRPTTGQDVCVAADLASRIDEGLSLSEAFRAIALEPAFRNRLLED
jgi:hypothetical protein